MEDKRIARGRHAPEKQERAREMGRAMTPSERLLWRRLKGNQLAGLHFRRQQVIDGFIVDFCCHEAKLVRHLETDLAQIQDIALPIHPLPIPLPFGEGCRGTRRAGSPPLK